MARAPITLASLQELQSRGGNYIVDRSSITARLLRAMAFEIQTIHGTRPAINTGGAEGVIEFSRRDMVWRGY